MAAQRPTEAVLERANALLPRTAKGDMRAQLLAVAQALSPETDAEQANRLRSAVQKKLIEKGFPLDVALGVSHNRDLSGLQRMFQQLVNGEPSSSSSTQNDQSAPSTQRGLAPADQVLLEKLKKKMPRGDHAHIARSLKRLREMGRPYSWTQFLQAEYILDRQKVIKGVAKWRSVTELGKMIHLMEDPEAPQDFSSDRVLYAMKKYFENDSPRFSGTSYKWHFERVDDESKGVQNSMKNYFEGTAYNDLKDLCAEAEALGLTFQDCNTFKEQFAFVGNEDKCEAFRTVMTVKKSCPMTAKTMKEACTIARRYWDASHQVTEENNAPTTVPDTTGEATPAAVPPQTTPDTSVPEVTCMDNAEHAAVQKYLRDFFADQADEEKINEAYEVATGLELPVQTSLHSEKPLHTVIQTTNAKISSSTS